MEKINDIFGHFLHVGKWNHEIKDWEVTFIRLDTIKSLEVIEVAQQLRCRVYTYKDQFYSCAMDPHDLIKELNKYLDKNMDFSDAVRLS